MSDFIADHKKGSFFQKTFLTTDVQLQSTMNVNVNSATNPNFQQPQMSPNIVPLPGMGIEKPVYLGGVSKVRPYKPAFLPQQAYSPMPSQGQPVYSWQQFSHNPAVYYQVPKRLTVTPLRPMSQALKREKKVIPILDPNTERDVTHEIIGSKYSSSAIGPTLPGFSTSIYSTPSPALKSKNNEIEMQFAKQDALAAAEPATKEHMMLPSSSRSIAPTEKFPVYYQVPMRQTVQTQLLKKREKKVIPILDPNTERDVMHEIIGCNYSSSVARPTLPGFSSSIYSTPSSPALKSKNNEIEMQFARQVALAAAEPDEHMMFPSSSRSIAPTEKFPVYYQVPMRQTVQTQPLKKREKKVIPILDPNTERDVTHEIIGCNYSSSAARPTLPGFSSSIYSTPSDVVVDDDIQLDQTSYNVIGWNQESSIRSVTGCKNMVKKESIPTNKFATSSEYSSTKSCGSQIASVTQGNVKSRIASSEQEQDNNNTASKQLHSHRLEKQDCLMPAEEGRENSSISHNVMETQLLGSSNISANEMKKRTESIISEFLYKNNLKEAAFDVCSLYSHSTIHLFVRNALNFVMEYSSQARLQVGQLTNFLIQEKIILVDQYIKGIEGISSRGQDYATKIPHFWGYLAEFIVPVLQDGTLPLSHIHHITQPRVEGGLAGKLTSEVLHALIKIIGIQKFTELWKNSNLSWTNFLPMNENEEQIITENKTDFPIATKEFLLQPQSSLEEIYHYLNDMLKNQNADNEVIIDWISHHVTEAQSKECGFIHNLVIAVVQEVLTANGTTWNLQEEALRKRCTLLVKYLNHKDELEHQAFETLQALIHHMEQPESILCQIFDTLYEENVISEETYLQWRRLSSVQRFYAEIKEVSFDTASLGVQRSPEMSGF